MFQISHPFPPIRAWARTLAFFAAAAAISAVAGTTYEFTASCADGRGNRVVEWRVGDIDPGKEFLRVSTGTNFPDCSITDYVESRDKGLPRETHQHVDAIWTGIPLIGPILCKLFCPWSK